MIELGLDRVVVEAAGKIDLFMNSPSDLSEPGCHNRNAVGLWFLMGLFLLAAFVGVFLWLRHPTKIIETHTTLQGGKKVDLRLVLQAPWRWIIPNHVVKMALEIDGRSVEMEKGSYYGLAPIDSTKAPAITVRGGFPDIAIFGHSGGSL